MRVHAIGLKGGKLPQRQGDDMPNTGNIYLNATDLITSLQYAWGSKRRAAAAKKLDDLFAPILSERNELYAALSDAKPVAVNSLVQIVSSVTPEQMETIVARAARRSGGGA